MPYILVETYNISEEPAASIFRFLRNYYIILHIRTSWTAIFIATAMITSDLR